MERETCHFNSLGGITLTVGTFGKCYTKNLRSHNGVGAVSLIEVATAEQEYCIGMFCLEVIELTHHRRYSGIFFGHKSVVFLCNNHAKIRKIP